MCTIINLTLFYSLFHHIGHSIHNHNLFLTIIKLSVSLCCCYQYLMYNESLIYMKPVITSFFIYDSFHIIFYKGLNTIVYNSILYHHLSILYALHIDPVISVNLSYIIFLGELSNIFMLNHYLLTKYANTNTIRISKKLLKISFYIEVITYLSIRCFYFTYLLVQKEWRDSFHDSFYYFCLPIYIMGMMWSNNLILQVKKKYISDKIN